MSVREIDPKYYIEAVSGDIAIISVTGRRIPDDEPLLLLRARDYLAVQALEHYKRLALVDNCTDFLIDGIDNRIEAFQRFAAEHPDRMKQPGATRGL